MGLDKQRLNYILFLVASSGFATIARAMSLTYLVIKLQNSFGLGPAMIGLLLGIGPLLGAVTSPFAGSLSDRVGRKAVLIAALLAMTAALFAMGLVSSLLAFCLAQIVSAVAIAVYEPISRALMSDVCPEPVRLKYFSWRYTASNFGWAVGPLIGLAAGAASAALFLTAGVAYALFALIMYLLPVPSSATGETSKVASVSVLESVKAASRDPRLAFFVCGGILMIALYGQWGATLAPYLDANVADGLSIYAYLGSINGAVVLIGNSFTRRFIQRAGALRALVIGCLLFAVAEIGYLNSTSFWGFAISMVVFTIGEILIVPSEYMLVDGISNAANRGSYFGAHSFSSIGNFVGPTLGGMVLGSFGGTYLFLIFAGFAMASALLFSIGTRMPPPRPKADRAAGPSAIPSAGLLFQGLSRSQLA